MRFLSLFAGIGGFDLGLERAGHVGLGQVEIDPFCRRILERRWPGVPQFGDVRSVALPHAAGEQFPERVDLLCGGFPCQDLSVAGKRAGLAGARSGLFWEIVRISQALRPAWGIFENVPGLVSSRGGRDMESVLAGLRECWPVVSYRVLDSQHFGVPQRRRRVFFVCGPDEARVAQVLFEPESGSGHPAAGREAGADVAASLTGGVGRVGSRGADDGVNIVTAIRHLGNGGPDDNEAQGGHLIAHPLKAEGADALEDGTGRGVPMVWSDPRRHDSRHRGTLREMPSLNASNNDLVGVRRLTPVECERLQAFPDGWTCECQELDAYAIDPEGAALRCTCPDGPRYRALGNAVTVNTIEWIGRRLARVAACPTP